MSTLQEQLSEERPCAVSGCNARQESWTCEQHSDRYPDALVKAACDHFDYALRLITGEIVYFTDCTLHGGWVHVRNDRFCDPTRGEDDFRQSSHDAVSFPIPAARGLDIRLEHIVWVADAPWGS